MLREYDPLQVLRALIPHPPSIHRRGAWNDKSGGTPVEKEKMKPPKMDAITSRRLPKRSSVCQITQTLSFQHTTMSAFNPSHKDTSWSPKTGMLTYLPPTWIPYAELMRIHKPVGIMNIFSPYLFGSLFAGCVSFPATEHKWLLARSTYLFIAAFVLRSAGCTWNDIADRDLKPLGREHPTETHGQRRHDPARSLCVHCCTSGCLACVTLADAAKAVAALRVATAVPRLTIPSKRSTDHARIVLGVILGWGVLVGAAAVGIDALAMGADDQNAGLLGLCLVYVVWSVIHDTVYAHQDV